MRISDWSSDVCSSDRKGPKSLRGLTPDLDKKLDTFLDTIDSKFELGFDFEARSTLLTQRAINAIDAVPPAIGRASCRERVCQYVSSSVVAVYLKKNTIQKR